MAVFVGCFVLAPEAMPYFEAYTVPRNKVFDQTKSISEPRQAMVVFLSV
jgi:hypothetical protein